MKPDTFSFIPAGPYRFPRAKKFGVFAGQTLEVALFSNPTIFDRIWKFDDKDAARHFDFLLQAGQTPIVKVACHSCESTASHFVVTSKSSHEFYCERCAGVLGNQFVPYPLQLSQINVFCDEDCRKQVLDVLRVAYGLPQKLKESKVYEFFKHSFERQLQLLAID